MRRLLPLALLTGCATAAPLPAAAPQPAACEQPPAAQAPAPPADPPLVVGEARAGARDDDERRKKLDAVAKELDAHLEAQLKQQGLPGFTFGVVVGGKLAYARAFGMADLEAKKPAQIGTVYRVGSITKTFTSAAILKLRDEGKLSLDVPASRYLPEMAKVVYPTDDAAPITLRHLLTHTSGLPRSGDYDDTRADSEPSERDVLDALTRTRLTFTPGTSHVYSNFGFSLLGLVVGKASGKPYRAYVKEALLEPLGMKTAAFDEADLPAGIVAKGYVKKGDKLEPTHRWKLGASEADGGLFASLEDMARYAAFQLDAYPARSGPDSGPLRRASVREAHTTVRHTELSTFEGEAGLPVDAIAHGQGLGWAMFETCEDDEVVWHNGAIDGFTASVHLFPRADAAMIMLTNHVGADRGKITLPARKILNKAGVLSPRAPDTVALGKAVGEAVALYNEFDGQRYEKAFTKSFRDAVSEAKLRAINASLRKEHGACKVGRPIEVDSPTHGRFELACERGHIEASGTIDEAGVITGFFVRSYVPPTDELSAALKDVLDPKVRARKKGLFASKEAAAEAEKQLASLSGSCSLDQPREQANEHEQAFWVTCGTSHKKLTLKLTGKKRGEVASVSIDSAPSLGKCVGMKR